VRTVFYADGSGIDEAWRLYQSNGRGKRALGELSMRELKKSGHRADIKEGKLVWIAAAELSAILF